ncbi:hypothetical protein PTKIN_Ptkin11bG0166700 [Pterospermum kingtungense]
MSVEVSALTASAPVRNPELSEINRRSAGYHPSIWGDHFLSYASNVMEDDHDKEEEHLRLKNELKKMLMADDVDEPLEKLKLIDAIQRLGLSYHFEKEIDQVLKLVHDDCDIGVNDEDLYTISLKFRLLRQNGYKMSCHAFDKFKDNEGKLKSPIVNDVRGMLSLYEAAHLRVHGEDILEEALAFTITHLNEAMATCLNSSLASQISNALKQPIRKGLPRLEARKYMPIYQEEPSHNEALLTFAKLDFNTLQRLHQEELSQIAKWWKELDFSRKLPFARDRVVECYFWILGVYFEPEYRFARRILTKVIAMTSVIDDIYDVYGTLEELVLFTKAVERWDISEKDQLPEYMQICYQALLDVYKEIEEKMREIRKLYRLDYAKEAMKNQVRAYFLEAEWFHNQHVPTLEEYMPLALVTSAYAMLATTSFVGMGEVATEEAFAWIRNDPTIVTASTIVCRLMDDIVSHKFEEKRGHVASAVACYMTQHGATEEEAVKVFNEQITNAWKDINEECLYPTTVPMPLLVRILNLARVIDVVYKNEDGYTHAEDVLKDFVASLLVDPVSK